MSPRIITAVLVAAAIVAGCGDDGGAAGPAVTVKTFQFEPDPIEIEAGQTVTWTNEDSTVHTVVSGARDAPDGDFDLELAESGGAAEFTFEEPGTYEYVCDIHSGPGMEASVIVR